MIGEDLRSFLLSSTGVTAAVANSTTPGVIEQNTIREYAPSPRIWYQRRNENEDLDLGGTGGIIESNWDIECHSEDPDEPFTIAAAVKSALHGHRGTFGSGSVQGVFVEDHDDDYIPKGVGSEEGLYVASFSARLFYAST